MAWTKEQKQAFAKAYNSGSSEADAKKAAGIGGTSKGNNNAGNGGFGGYTPSAKVNNALDSIANGSYLQTAAKKNPFAYDPTETNPFAQGEAKQSFDEWSANNGMLSRDDWNNQQGMMNMEQWAATHGGTNADLNQYNDYRKQFDNDYTDYNLKFANDYNDYSRNYDSNNERAAKWDADRAEQIKNSQAWEDLHKDEDYTGKEGLKYLADQGFSNEDLDYIFNQMYTDPRFEKIVGNTKDSAGDILNVAEEYSKFLNGEDLGPITGTTDHLYSGGYQNLLDAEKALTDTAATVIDKPDSQLSDVEKTYKEAYSDWSNWVRQFKEEYRQLRAEEGKYSEGKGFSGNTAEGEQQYIMTRMADFPEAVTAYDELQALQPEMDKEQRTNPSDQNNEDRMRYALNAANELIDTRHMADNMGDYYPDTYGLLGPMGEEPAPEVASPEQTRQPSTSSLRDWWLRQRAGNIAESENLKKGSPEYERRVAEILASNKPF